MKRKPVWIVLVIVIEAQADPHICLLHALGINTAAVMGVSARGPSAMQAAIRHPDRTWACSSAHPAHDRARVRGRIWRQGRQQGNGLHATRRHGCANP